MSDCGLPQQFIQGLYIRMPRILMLQFSNCHKCNFSPSPILWIYTDETVHLYDQKKQLKVISQRVGVQILYLLILSCVGYVLLLFEFFHILHFLYKVGFPETKIAVKCRRFPFSEAGGILFTLYSSEIIDRLTDFSVRFY